MDSIASASQLAHNSNNISATTDSFLHLQFPQSSSTMQHQVQPSASASTSIHPVVLFSIIDHYIRRTESSQRVYGVLLGVRSDDGLEIELRNCFPLPVTEKNASGPANGSDAADGGDAAGDDGGQDVSKTIECIFVDFLLLTQTG